MRRLFQNQSMPGRKSGYHFITVVRFFLFGVPSEGYLNRQCTVCEGNSEVRGKRDHYSDALLQGKLEMISQTHQFLKI
jgi:hypothetical protein